MKVSPRVLYIAGALFVLIGVLMVLSRAGFLASAVHARGEVAEVRQIEQARTGRRRSHSTRLVVNFLDERGLPHSLVAEVADPADSWRAGATAEVVYPSGQPGRASLGGFEGQWLQPLTWIAVGLALAFVGWARIGEPQS